MRDRVTELLTKWVSLQEEHPAEKVQAAFVAELDKEGFLKVGRLGCQTAGTRLYVGSAPTDDSHACSWRLLA